jgi:hypothetical protein
MAQKKFDGVIEAVRYTGSGQVAVVRAYERRGPAFSDHVLLDRGELIKRLRSGKRFVVGSRKPYLGGMFEVGGKVRLLHTQQGDILTNDGQADGHDQLKGVPQF